MQEQQQQHSRVNDDAARLLIVEKDVSGLKDSMSSLAMTVNKGFESISAEMKAKSTTNWQPIGICLAAVFTISGWGFGLFSNFQGRTEAAITEQKILSRDFVPRQDIKDKFDTAKDRRDDAQRMTDARLTRVEADLEGISKQIVPRGEHAEKWLHQRSIDEAIQRQVDGIRSELTGINSPRDTVQNIMRRLEDVERARINAEGKK